MTVLLILIKNNVETVKDITSAIGKATIQREVHRALKGCMLPELKPQADA